MAEWILLVSAVSISLVYMGILRTAIWLVATIVVQDSAPFVCASQLAFFSVASLAAPYRKKAFDFRDLPRNQWIGILFFSGVLTGSLLYPASIVLFLGGAILPMFFIALFRLLRMPVSQVLFFPKNIRYLAPIALVVNFLIKGYQLLQS